MVAIVGGVMGGGRRFRPQADVSAPYGIECLSSAQMVTSMITTSRWRYGESCFEAV